VQGEAEVSDDWGTHSQVSERERRMRLGQSGAVVWVSAEDPSDATSLAYAIERRLFDVGRVAIVAAEGDGIGRSGPHSPEGSAEMGRRLADAGLIAVFALSAPTRADRARVADAQRSEHFFEVFAKRAASRGRGFEAPTEPSVVVDLDNAEVESAAGTVVEALGGFGLFDEG
jgi:adenylylsulfate kinase-like enzyme